jgi:hypothetical protein
MSITNFAYSARFAGAWLVLAALTTTLGLQLLAQLRDFRTVGSPAAQLCIQTTSAEPARRQTENPSQLP